MCGPSQLHGLGLESGDRALAIVRLPLEASSRFVRREDAGSIAATISTGYLFRGDTCKQAEGIGAEWPCWLPCASRRYYLSIEINRPRRRRKSCRAATERDHLHLRR